MTVQCAPFFIIKCIALDNTTLRFCKIGKYDKYLRTILPKSILGVQ